MNSKEIKLSAKKYSYPEFISLVKSLYAENKVTGAEQSEAKIEATKINIQRYERIYKTTQLNDDLVQTIKSVTNPMVWYLIVEGWCGDCAQIVPVIARIADINNAFELKIVVRDENPEFMDAYLTNGGRSVPKLICFDKKTGNEIFQYGPRSQKIQEQVKKYKLDNPDVSHEEFVKNVHLFYAQDRTQSVQNEFMALFA